MRSRSAAQPDVSEGAGERPEKRSSKIKEGRRRSRLSECFDEDDTVCRHSRLEGEDDDRERTLLAEAADMAAEGAAAEAAEEQEDAAEERINSIYMEERKHEHRSDNGKADSPRQESRSRSLPDRRSTEGLPTRGTTVPLEWSTRTT